jgi:peptidoglycan hydrolase-like protein with peptidoglycan-binding domain
MGLQSDFFSGDPKLEACLTRDSAHVTPGSVGDHVSKIQIALTTLDNSDIDEGELTSGTYGPSTAAAVLAFKKKRNIINPSYQSQADNIVGKMTIAALDREIFEKEKPRTGNVCSLGPEQIQGRNITRGVS